MIVDTVVVGSFEENCYILSKNNEVIIIDPGDDFSKIDKVINGRKILGILITHNHFDHVGALSYFKNVPKYSFDNLEEKEYEIGPFRFRVVFTPGHTNDSVSFYFMEDNLLFCGDFIFYHSIGRCDLPSGSEKDMQNSIKKISAFPNEMILYPGHGISTLLEEEKRNNYYFNMIEWEKSNY